METAVDPQSLRKLYQNRGRALELAADDEWQTSRSFVLIQIAIADAHLKLSLGKPEQAFGIWEE